MNNGQLSNGDHNVNSFLVLKVFYEVENSLKLSLNNQYGLAFMHEVIIQQSITASTPRSSFCLVSLTA